MEQHELSMKNKEIIIKLYIHQSNSTYNIGKHQEISTILNQIYG